PFNRSVKMVRRESKYGDGSVRMVLDGVSIIRYPDGTWCRVAPPSAHDLKDNWYRSSPSLLIRWLDAVGKRRRSKSNES
ncbi:MAG: hypothetical protein ACWGNO_11640, partial [Desulfobacterales bacterium]